MDYFGIVVIALASHSGDPSSIPGGSFFFFFFFFFCRRFKFDFMIFFDYYNILSYTITNIVIKCLILRVISMGEICQSFEYNPMGNLIPCRVLNLI